MNLRFPEKLGDGRRHRRGDRDVELYKILVKICEKIIGKRCAVCRGESNESDESTTY